MNWRGTQEYHQRSKRRRRTVAAWWLMHYATSRKVAGSRPDETNEVFSVHLIITASLEPGVYSASIRNDYKKQKNSFWGIERGRCVELKTLPLSINRLSIQCAILNISQPYRPPRPVTGIALLYGDGVCFP
jgi:hypothetical protein